MRRKTLKAKLKYALGLEPRAQTERYRLWKLPRYVAGTTDLVGPRLSFPDARSFLYMYDEIMVKGIYEFKSPSPAPRIIDGGANIGLATLYLKRLYPQARITAFEPDLGARRCLEANLGVMGLTDVEVLPYALWSSEGELTFAAEGADGGRVLNGPNDETPVVARATVQTRRLRDYLNEPVDLLKLDIEGAEGEVMMDCRDALGQVRHLFVEYHSFVHRPQGLGAIVQIIEDAGFRHHVTVTGPSARPFADLTLYSGKDNYLNIFAWR